MKKKYAHIYLRELAVTAASYAALFGMAWSVVVLMQWMGRAGYLAFALIGFVALAAWSARESTRLRLMMEADDESPSTDQSEE
ncbi:hypothetical protein [Paludisphaera rhizosphaerae]|uniref:hypothetical protein n=1 Tax=Paludisphaera rhizosphaerae TaxID=2711216 RepID=UPI0013EA2638|nr:hypothetical protein [Paludisphaera rhizosphaerae]